MVCFTRFICSVNVCSVILRWWVLGGEVVIVGLSRKRYDRDRLGVLVCYCFLGVFWVRFEIYLLKELSLILFI